MHLQKYANQVRWGNEDEVTFLKEKDKFFMVCKKEVTEEYCAFVKSALEKRKSCLQETDYQAERSKQIGRLDSDISGLPI